MRILNVPTTSITEVKKNPNKIFDQAKKEKTGVYVFNHNDVSGVMLSKDQYEALNQRIDLLEEKIFDYEAAIRISKKDVKTYSDIEVRGHVALEPIIIDDHDRWE